MCNGTLFTVEKISPQAGIKLGLLDQYARTCNFASFSTVFQSNQDDERLSFSTVFQSYQDDERLILKGCVPWNSV